jgi:hypothetical protein
MDFNFGRRFHGSIIAMQAAVPSLMVAVDDRMREMLGFTGLPAVDTTDVEKAENRAEFVADHLAGLNASELVDRTPIASGTSAPRCARSASGSSGSGQHPRSQAQFQGKSCASCLRASHHICSEPWRRIRGEVRHRPYFDDIRTKAELIEQVKKIANTGNYLIGEGAAFSLKAHDVTYVPFWHLANS